MTAEEIREAAEQGVLPVIEDVDPSTAAVDGSFLVISGRAAMPLDGVGWSFDRSYDLPILDEMGSELGTLCLVGDKPPLRISEMTAWRYTAYLADCDRSAIGSESHQFTRDYAVIDQPELKRYVEHYLAGSALWGEFHHGTTSGRRSGYKREIRARPDIVVPTIYHEESFMLVAQAPGPREQYLKIYHTIELLFDFITYRKIVQAGDDLIGFGKIMTGYQRAELERLKSVIREYCSDIDAIASKMLELGPFLSRAEQMFQIHSKDGNPLGTEEKWGKFCALIQGRGIDPEAVRKAALAPNRKAYDELVVNLAAYQVYRIRSSIAHSRIGEYVLTEIDDTFIAEFGIGLIEEVALQIFGSKGLAKLVS